MPPLGTWTPKCNCYGTLTDHINIRILQHVNCGIPLVLGLGTRVSVLEVYVVFWAIMLNTHVNWAPDCKTCNGQARRAGTVAVSFLKPPQQTQAAVVQKRAEFKGDLGCMCVYIYICTYVCIHMPALYTYIHMYLERESPCRRRVSEAMLGVSTRQALAETPLSVEGFVSDKSSSHSGWHVLRSPNHT